MTKTHDIVGANQVHLHVRESGNPEGPSILFIHGWSCAQACWNLQVTSSLADEFRLVTFDLRGHGMSDKPAAIEQYNNSDVWADDVKAIIDTLGLGKTVLVGWSYGGLVVLDYVRKHGQDSLAGAVLVGPAVELSPDAFGTLIGPGFLSHAEGSMVDNLQTNINTMRSFAHTMAVKPVEPAYFEEALCWSVIVPHYIRGALVAREVRNNDILAAMRVPVLVIQGEADTCAMPAVARHVETICPTAKAEYYPAIGHMPFAEDTKHFNRDLAEFTNKAAK